VLKHCAANRKRRLLTLPNVTPYIYDVKISGFTSSSIYIYDISRLRVNCLGHGPALNIGTVVCRAQILGVRFICLRDCVTGMTHLASCCVSEPANGFGGNLVDVYKSYGCPIFIAIFCNAFVLNYIN
jgi:hypothetical protein